MVGVGASRRTVVVIATVAVLLVVLIAARHAIVRLALQGILSAATGYQVRFSDQIIGSNHAVFFDVHVVKNGDPVLDAQRVDVEYALRDIFPGGQHRYGFAALAIQKPVLTITRHADGTLTFNRTGGTSAAPPAPTRQAAAPLYFTLRVRDGAIRLVDAAPLQADLANQSIVNVSIDASVKSDARTTAKASGVLLGRRAQDAPVTRYPLSARTVIDVQRGIGLNRIAARELPLRGVLGFIIHSPAIRFDDGVIDRLDVQYFAIARRLGEDFQYRLGGSTELRGGRITVSALQRSIRDLHAQLTITDDMLATGTVDARLGGVPIQGRGAIYDLFGTPAMRLGFAANADMQRLRELFSFSASMPLHGSARIESIIESKIAQPLIHTSFSSGHLSYDRFPVDGLDGVVDYYDNAISIDAFHARYGIADMLLGGRVLLTDTGSDLQFALNARGPGRGLPYTDVLAPDANVVATLLLAEPPGAGFSARGTIGVSGATSGSGTFAVDQHGVGEFGPLAFVRADGSFLAGGFELQRPISQSAGWLHLRGFRLAEIRNEAALPGANVPALPPIAGVIDGDLAGGGTPDAFGLAGAINGRDLRVAGYDFGRGSVRLSGSLSDVRLAGIVVDGPLGHFQGEGAYGGNTFALDGRYDGSLEALRPFIADTSAHGAVHGDMRATLGQNHIVVQTTGARFADAQVRGVAVDSLTGTLTIDGQALRIVAADGSIGGGRAIAADKGGPFLVSAPAVPVEALRGVGLPLQGGTLSLFGQADLRGRAPRFDGLVGVMDGSAAGYPVSGGADVALADGTAQVRSGVGALGSTYADFAGRVNGVGAATIAYDLNARVPIGDIGEVRRVLRLPLRTLEGSFSAQLRVRGSGAQPRIAGDVAVPEGSYNGLAFHDARAAVALSQSSVSAQNGVITVGTTHANVDASGSIARRAFNVDVRSANANLADFDDYFDEAETLDGRGAVALAFANDGSTTRTTGRMNVRDFRYRRFAFGTTDATWSQRGRNIQAALNVRGAHGALRANGSVLAATGDPISAFQHAAYNAKVQARQVDLATWLPPFGINWPVLGQVDASGSVVGRWPRLGITGDASLTDGSLYGYAVRDGHVRARSDSARMTFSDTVLDLGFVRFDASGSAGFDKRDPLALSVHGQAADIGKALVTLLPKGPRYDVGGAIQADARIGGTVAQPRVSLGFELTDARYRTLQIPRILGSVGFDGHTLIVNDAEATFTKGTALVAGSLPFSLQPFGVNSEAPVSFTLALGGVDLTPFAPFVPGPQTKLGGTVDGRLAFEGTLNAPRVIGNIALANGSYFSNLDRAGVKNANAQLAFLGTSVALQALHANLGTGTLDGSGQLDLPFPGVHTSNYAVVLNAHGARIDSPQYGSGTIDGTMQLKSESPVPMFSGDLTVANASIPILSIYRNTAGGGGGGGVRGLPLDVAFDVRARAAKNVRVQASSPYIDIGTTGTLALTGTLAAPKLDGVLTATPGGLFSTYNRAFRVQQAVVTFNPANGVLPYVDLRAYAHVTNPDPDPTRNAVGSADITVTVQGPADELAAGTGSGIVYSSNPPYSQEQIIGLLLDASVFGAVNFGQQQNGVTLRGAPGESNPLLPPGVTPYQAGVLNFNQEAFSILNGQLTQRLLAPVERVFTGPLDLSDFELTVDYGGGLGYNALKQVGKRDIYASLGQILSTPVRSTAGFTARPDATTSIQFSYFTQNGNPAYTNNANGSASLLGPVRLKGIQPLSNRQGFTFLIVRKYP